MIMAGLRQRKQNLLTTRTIETAKEPGRYSDGNGLYLVVRPGGSKQWMFLYRRDSKLKEMGLGSPAKASRSLWLADCETRRGRSWCAASIR